MPSKDDFCVCCLAQFPWPPKPGRRFCAACDEHRTWCVSMQSKVARWDGDAQRWRVVRVIEAEGNLEPADASWLE